MARFNYIELPARDFDAARIFYSAALGWELTDFGPSYSCTMTGDVDLGLQGDMSEAPRMPLPVVLVDDIEAAQTAVAQAGGTISKPIFAFPGGRRFHFLDPNGLELAIMQTDSPDLFPEYHLLQEAAASLTGTDNCPSLAFSRGRPTSTDRPGQELPSITGGTCPGMSSSNLA